MSKNTKKWIVNVLTGTRVLTTLLLPILCTFMSAPSFVLLVGAVLFTDFLDGKLARHFEVCTLFGSLLDMGADKLLGISLLIVLTFTYPILAIPATFEVLIGSINTKSVLKGNKAKSKWTGKIKMVVSFFSILSLLMIGASPEISHTLENYSGTLRDIGKTIADFFINNKEIIENIAIPATIAAEVATFIDYSKDYNKIKDNESKKLLEELKKYKNYIQDYKVKEYMKEIMFDEEYHKKTVDEPLIKKLTPNKNKELDK